MKSKMDIEVLSSTAKCESDSSAGLRVDCEAAVCTAMVAAAQSWSHGEILEADAAVVRSDQVDGNAPSNSCCMC